MMGQGLGPSQQQSLVLPDLPLLLHATTSPFLPCSLECFPLPVADPTCKLHQLPPIPTCLGHIGAHRQPPHNLTTEVSQCIPCLSPKTPWDPKVGPKLPLALDLGLCGDTFSTEPNIPDSQLIKL